MTTTINGSSPSITFSDGSAQTSATRPFQNRIINGAFTINQYALGTVTPTNNQYVIDRFFCELGAAGKITTQQSSSAPAGFSNSLLVTSTSAYTLGATEYIDISQTIEGFNFDLGWGTANAKTVTLSFWVQSSLTGTFGGVLSNSAQNRSYPFTYTISVANTWEQKSVTIAGDTTGTWIGATNGKGLLVKFNLGLGATYAGTPNAWASALYLGATGCTSLVATSGATWNVTGVQLEVGSTATSFDYRPFGTELALCQRYFWKQTYQQANTRFGTGIGLGDTTIDGLLINLPVPMRAVPTNAVNAIGVYDGTTAKNITALNTSYSSPVLFAQQATADATTTAGKVVQIYATGSTAFVSSSAEL